MRKRKHEVSGTDDRGDVHSFHTNDRARAEDMRRQLSEDLGELQPGPGSLASIEQQGRGQFALVEQRGENNRASIFQALGATNATAAIVQTGNGNTYDIRQDQPGQYLHATQTGTGNAVTTVIARGPGS